MTIKTASVILFLSTLMFLAHGKDTSNVASQLGKLAEDSKTSINITNNSEQMITLNYDGSKVSTPTGCSLLDPFGISITTPCSCSTGICTVGITPLGIGSARFNYTVQSSTGAYSGEFNITINNVFPIESCR